MNKAQQFREIAYNTILSDHFDGEARIAAIKKMDEEYPKMISDLENSAKQYGMLTATLAFDSMVELNEFSRRAALDGFRYFPNFHNGCFLTVRWD